MLRLDAVGLEVVAEGHVVQICIDAQLPHSELDDDATVAGALHSDGGVAQQLTLATFQAQLLGGLVVAGFDELAQSLAAATLVEGALHDTSLAQGR